MQNRLCLTAALVWLSLAASASAQFKEGEPDGAKLGDTTVTRWQIGVVITASGGPLRSGSGYMAVPQNWPEQEVNVISEDVSPEIKIHYSTISGGVKLMNMKIGQLAAGQEVKAVVVFETRRTTILPPDKTDNYVLPNTKKLPGDMRLYLAPGPQIESRDPKIRELAKTIGADKEKAWDRVEAIYDWVRERVKYKVKSGDARSATVVLKDGTGDCEEFSSLFVAICRAADIPARMVWVRSHVYPEFYLEDENGKGHWFPCQSAGARQFGGITETRPIWQKGDNIRPPINTKKHKPYLDFGLSITPIAGSGEPLVRSFRDPAPL